MQEKGRGGVWVSSLTSSAEVSRSAGVAVSSAYCDSSGSTWQTHQFHLKVKKWLSVLPHTQHHVGEPALNMKRIRLQEDTITSVLFHTNNKKNGISFPVLSSH